MIFKINPIIIVLILNATQGVYEIDGGPIVTQCDVPRPAVPATAVAAPAPPPSHVCTSTPQRTYATAAAATASSSKRPVTLRGPREITHRGSRKDRRDEDGFTVVKKKKKKPANRNHCGTAPTGPNHLLRPAIPSTPLYVSRLHWSTKVEDVVDYVEKKTNFTLRVERLESRHKVNFNSFLVRVPSHHLPTFVKEEFWPQGVVFRRFRGQLPAEKPRIHVADKTLRDK